MLRGSIFEQNKEVKRAFIEEEINADSEVWMERCSAADISSIQTSDSAFISSSIKALFTSLFFWGEKVTET